MVEYLGTMFRNQQVQMNRLPFVSLSLGMMYTYFNFPNINLQIHWPTEINSKAYERKKWARIAKKFLKKKKSCEGRDNFSVKYQPFIE